MYLKIVQDLVVLGSFQFPKLITLHYFSLIHVVQWFIVAVPRNLTHLHYMLYAHMNCIQYIHE